MHEKSYVAIISIPLNERLNCLHVKTMVLWMKETFTVYCQPVIMYQCVSFVFYSLSRTRLASFYHCFLYVTPSVRNYTNNNFLSDNRDVCYRNSCGSISSQQ